MNKAKKIIQILLMMIVIGSLVGCGKKQEKAVVPDSDDWHDAQVIAHNIRLKDVGNLTVSDVEKLGFNKSLYQNDVEPNDNTMISFTAADGSKDVYDFRVKNKTGKKTTIDKCNIDAAYIIITNDEDNALERATDIYLANGVKAGMTSKEVKSIMGEPDKEKISEDDETLYKRWTYNLNSEGGKIVIVFEKNKDTISTMIIYY